MTSGARLHALPCLYRVAEAGLPTLADPGYDGAGIGRHPGQATRRRPGTRYRPPHPRRLVQGFVKVVGGVQPGESAKSWSARRRFWALRLVSSVYLVTPCSGTR